MNKLIKDIVYQAEAIVKKELFDCHGCGQCMLSQTGFICPMSCPKGLRNGPCGGTKGGFCEVYPEKECVWVRIQNRRSQYSTHSPGQNSYGNYNTYNRFFAPVNQSLFNTSSLVNFISGKDRAARIPISPQNLNPLKPLPAETEYVFQKETKSRLESIIQNKSTVITAEIRTPKTEKGLSQVKKEVALLSPLVDALNITSDHGGVKRLDPLIIAKEIKNSNCEAIVQVCGRDVDPDSFKIKMQDLYHAGFNNVLCLTGDWPAQINNKNSHTIKTSFAMDSSQMIFKAKKSFNSNTADMFIGGAINPQSTPCETVIARLQQKIDCGANFIQTQVTCDAQNYLVWLKTVKASLPTQIPILVGIPYVGTKGGLEALRTLPGVSLPDATYENLGHSENITQAGCLFARETIQQLLDSKLVDGFHLMNFGISAELMAKEIKYLHAISNPAPSPTLVASKSVKLSTFSIRRTIMQQTTHKTIENDPAKTVLSGNGKEISITPSSHTFTIGERCNALGYKSVKKAIEEQRYEFLVERAIEQEQAGADIINVSTVGSDVPEIESLPEAVRQIARAVSIPLSIDFGSLEALDAALEQAPERSLINSVSGESSKCEPVFELAQKHNAALIAMPCTDKGIPKTARDRLEVAIELINKASEFGIPKDDLIFDAICLAVATDQNAGLITFETCQLLRSQLGVNITLGASNVSFGLPNRRTLDSTYLSMAIASGMNVALTDITIPTIKWAMRSADCCLGQDMFATRYIQEFRRESAGACA